MTIRYGEWIQEPDRLGVTVPVDATWFTSPTARRIKVIADDLVTPYTTYPTVVDDLVKQGLAEVASGNPPTTNASQGISEYGATFYVQQATSTVNGANASSDVTVFDEVLGMHPPTSLLTVTPPEDPDAVDVEMSAPYGTVLSAVLDDVNIGFDPQTNPGRGQVVPTEVTLTLSVLEDVADWVGKTWNNINLTHKRTLVEATWTGAEISPDHGTAKTFTSGVDFTDCIDHSTGLPKWVVMGWSPVTYSGGVGTPITQFGSTIVWFGGLFYDPDYTPLNPERSHVTFDIRPPAYRYVYDDPEPEPVGVGGWSVGSARTRRKKGRGQ